MADFTITIPDAIETRLLDAIAAKHHYDPLSGLSKAQFARKMIYRWLRDQLENYEGNIAALNAEADAKAIIRQDMPDA